MNGGLHLAFTFAHPLPALWRCASTRFAAVPGAGNFTGATPAFAAVSRHNAYSSLLSSLWGSPQLASVRGIYEFANV